MDCCDLALSPDWLNTKVVILRLSIDKVATILFRFSATALRRISPSVYLALSSFCHSKLDAQTDQGPRNQETEKKMSIKKLFR